MAQRIIRKLKQYGKLAKVLFYEVPRRNRTISSDYDLGNGIKLFYYRLQTDYKHLEDETENLGDYLSTVVVSHFLPVKNNINNNLHLPSSKTIFGIGSILGFRCQNAIVWGSGILYPTKPYLFRIRMSRMDIRAVRGPKTRDILLKCGKTCPSIYGDPAILMPFIFNPLNIKKKYKVSLVLNHAYRDFDIPKEKGIHHISILTKDYRRFITQIMESELVISSSLHGIILAEVYGVPAILLLKNNTPTFKYEDWYYSTGRTNYIIAHSVEEAMRLEPMELPDFSKMQKQLISSFPVDLWR